jgi:hypothetical protein
MVKKILCFALLFFLVFPLVSALVSEVTVHTEPEHNLSVYVKNPIEENKEITFLSVNSDTDGYATFSVSSDAPRLSFSITARKNGKIADSGDYEDRIAGGTIIIDMIEAPVVEPEETIIQNSSVNESENDLLSDESAEEPEETAETENSSKSFLPTGKVISVLKENKRILFYLFGAVVLFGAIIFFSINMKKNHSNEDIKVKKLSDVQKEKVNSEEDSQRITELQAQIAHAQQEINKIKNKDKIEEVRKKLEEDKKELEELEKDND